MKWRSGPLALAVLAAMAFAALFVLAGPWAPSVAPPLVQVTALAPVDVEPGDRIVISGEGFPPGRQAQVRFRGTLHRPGERPVQGAEVSAAGVVTGPEQVEVDFGEAAQALFCGVGDRAAHTTFEGSVEVAFAASVPGAAPIAGVLERALLDVRPSASPADRARAADGERVAAFLGLEVSAPFRRGIGVAIGAVRAGSPAAAAGLEAGDTILSFDGVRAEALGDLVPPAGEREAVLGVLPAGATTEVPRPVSLAGFRRAPPAELLGTALVIAGALAVLGLFAASGPRDLASALSRGSSRLRARGGFGALLAGAAREVLPLSWASASASVVVDASAAAALAVLPFGQYLVAARCDVGILFFAAATAVAVVAVAGAGSAWAGVRGAMHVAWQHVPAALAVVSVVVATGSLRVQEVDRAQGGWPLDWLAFRSPALLLALGLLLGCTFVAPPGDPRPASDPRAAASPGSLLSGLIDPGAEPPAPPRGPWLAAALRAHRFVIAGLASALFLGGWSIPGLSSAQQDGRPLLELAGAACFLGKTLVLSLVLAGLRQALPGRSPGERSRATLRRGLPLALGALALTAVWVRWTPDETARLLVSGSLVAAATLAVLSVAHRLRHGVLAPGAEGHLSPFL